MGSNNNTISLAVVDEKGALFNYEGPRSQIYEHAEGFEHSHIQAALAILWLSVQDARNELEFSESETNMEQWAVDIIPAATFLISQTATPQQLREAKGYVVGVFSDGCWSLDAL